MTRFYPQLFEKFIEKSDPIGDMGLGIGKYLKEIILSIFEQDHEKLIFSIQYAYPTSNPRIHFHLNQPKMNVYRHLCKNEAIKDYIENLISKIEYSSIFSDIITEGKFKFYYPDPDDPMTMLKTAPKIYGIFSQEIKSLPKYEIFLRRDFDDNHKIIKINR